MNKNLAIRVDSLSKCYRIGVKDQIDDNLASAMGSFLKSPLRNYRKYRALYKFDDSEIHSAHGPGANSSDIIWALKDVSFHLEKGQSLGIIGKNGAGKSTLLKVISRITSPTNGRVEIRGRISSLLEVGTGFHPELTGRENVYLNATILGMTKKEVDRKFDEIVEFSGVEKFIETPVKRYSSGMQVRLAFSVAAHLEPEILIVDEVLAVGDAEFQKKCLGKMDQVRSEGRTVLFVSHNMGAISQLCNRAILLEDGQLKSEGSPPDVIKSYLSSGGLASSTWENVHPEHAEPEVHLKSARVLSQDHEPASVIDFNRNFLVEISYEVLAPVRNLVVLCRLSDYQDNVLWTSWDIDSTDWNGRVRQPGNYLSVCKVPGCLLRPDRYLLSVGAFIPNVKIFSYHPNALTFDISTVGYGFNEGRVGIIRPLFDWDVIRNHESE